MFNVPTVVLAILAVLFFIQAVREWALTDEQNLDVLLYFAFIPARYDASVLGQEGFPGGLGPQIWTFLTYAFLHADFTHVGVNSIWLLPFGAAMARRFGALRFLAFFAVTAIAGSALHLVTHWGEVLPMIGASAAVSGLMAGSLRFIFQAGGPLAMFRTGDEAAYRVPAAPLLVALRNTQVVFSWWRGSGSTCCSGSDRRAFPASSRRSPGRPISAASLPG